MTKRDEIRLSEIGERLKEVEIAFMGWSKIQRDHTLDQAVKEVVGGDFTVQSSPLIYERANLELDELYGEMCALQGELNGLLQEAKNG